VLRLLAQSGARLPQGQADAFITGLREALQAAHATIDPATGAPLCLGAICYGNILFSPAGRWHLLGFGRNFPVEKDSAAPDGSTALFVAPEVAVGAPPSATADYIALLLLSRSLMPWVDFQDKLVRVLRSDSTEDDREFGRVHTLV